MENGGLRRSKRPRNFVNYRTSDYYEAVLYHERIRPPSDRGSKRKAAPVVLRVKPKRACCTATRTEDQDDEELLPINRQSGFGPANEIKHEDDAGDVQMTAASRAVPPRAIQVDTDGLPNVSDIKPPLSPPSRRPAEATVTVASGDGKLGTAPSLRRPSASEPAMEVLALLERQEEIDLKLERLLVMKKLRELGHST